MSPKTLARSGNKVTTGTSQCCLVRGCISHDLKKSLICYVYNNNTNWNYLVKKLQSQKLKAFFFWLTRKVKRLETSKWAILIWCISFGQQKRCKTFYNSRNIIWPLTFKVFNFEYKTDENNYFGRWLQNIYTIYNDIRSYIYSKPNRFIRYTHVCVRVCDI